MIDLPPMQEVERLLDTLRGQADPIEARRFACSCVRHIWAMVESQRHVSLRIMEHCRGAVALTEQSLVGPVGEQDLRAVDFGAITDAGNEAFMAAAHVGWNLFAPLNGLDAVDEFDFAKQTAFLAACAGGSDELNRQIRSLQEIVAQDRNGQGLATKLDRARQC